MAGTSLCSVAQGWLESDANTCSLLMIGDCVDGSVESLEFSLEAPDCTDTWEQPKMKRQKTSSSWSNDGWDDAELDEEEETDDNFVLKLSFDGADWSIEVDGSGELAAAVESSSMQVVFGDTKLDRDAMLLQILRTVASTVSTLKGHDAWEDNNDGADSDGGEQGFMEEVQKLRTRAQSFSTLSLDQASKLQQESVHKIASIADCSPGVAFFMLLKERWDTVALIEKLRNSSKSAIREIAEQSGGLQSEEEKCEAPGAEQTVSCQICFDDVPFEQSFALQCGHRQCISCYREHLQSALRAGTCAGESVVKTKCPGYDAQTGKGCTTRVPPSVFRKLLLPEDAKEFDRRLRESFVNDNDGAKWCPSPECSGTYFVAFSKRRRTVHCSKCEQRFCFRCGETAHWPASCQEYEAWRARDKGMENIDRNFILKDTKPCPHCGTRTHKNGGCMYMSCTNCSKSWCWQCGKGDHHVWECNRPVYGEMDTEDNEARYLFYYERSYNHAQSLKFSEDQLKETAERIRELTAAGEPFRYAAFLMEAVRIVIEARMVLRWTYVRAFFEKRDVQREVFEMAQSQLEEQTERLNQLVEKTAIEVIRDDLTSFRRKVLSLTRALSGFLDNVVHWTFEDVKPVQTP
ncbi:MAG: hypothetical protein MHM6MM_002873 [Cercozoa sp. M6MM]